MSKIILLDTGPLGILTNPNPTAKVQQCQRWAAGLVRAGCQLIVPEVSDYELRREYVRQGLSVSIQLLDGLASIYGYLPITTVAMRHAAELWALARRTGQQTAHDLDLDADMILCGQVRELNDPTAVVATGNAAHLGRFVPAADWLAVTP